MRSPKMAPRWRQDASKMASRRLQVASYRDLFLSYLRLPRGNLPKPSQDRLRAPMGLPRGPPRPPRDRPGTPPGPFQDALGTPSGTLSAPSRALLKHVVQASCQHHAGGLQQAISNHRGWPVMRRRRSRSGHTSVGRDKMSVKTVT